MINLSFNFATVVLGGVIAQGFFTSFLLLLQKNNHSANRFLVLLLLSFSLWLCDTFFKVSTIYAQNPDFYFLPIYYSFGFGPLIYFYTKSITERDFSFKGRYFWHFVPVFLQAIFYLLLQTKGYSFRRWFWLEVHRPHTYDLEFNLSLISLVIYLFLSLYVVRRYQIWTNNHYSEISKISLNWLKIVHGFLILTCLVWLLDAILREVWIYYPDQPFSAIAMGLSVLTLAGGALLQSDLQGMPAETGIDNIVLSDEVDLKIVEKIKAEMLEGRYYLDPGLTLDKFALQLALPARRVSFHLNGGLGMPFIDFVNEHRIQEVKQHLENNDLPHLSLLGIALESGFSSKSTFNRVFRKFMQQSPSDYHRQVKNKS